MLKWVDIAQGSSSDPGQSGELSPYCEMDSMYFDNSLYENEMHYKLSKYLDEDPLPDDWESIRIVCDNEEEYNKTLDKLYHYSDGIIKVYGTTNEPMDIIVEKDPRENYRKFDENQLEKDK
jgi:hypothetical protein